MLLLRTPRAALRFLAGADSLSLGDFPVQPVEQVFKRALELGPGVVFRQRVLQPLHVRELAEVELLVGVRDVGLALVERLFGWRGLGAEQARLEQEVAEQKAGKGAVGRHGPGVAEPAGDQRGEEVFDHAQAAQRGTEPRRGRVPGGDQWKDVRMLTGQRPDPVREPLEVSLPAVSRPEGAWSG